MNRIYQGRVSRVQTLRPNASGKSIDDWEDCPSGLDLLWKHHERFQDATNYYAVALLALASDPGNPLFRVRERIVAVDNTDSVWKDFFRHGIKRTGLAKSVAPYLGLDPGNVTPDECFARILDSNPSQPELLDLAAVELLGECNGEGAIQQKGREMFPRFCWDAFTGSYPKSQSSKDRKANENRLYTELHHLATDQDRSRFASEATLDWVVNLNEAEPPYTGAESRDRLAKASIHFLQAFGQPATTKMGDRVAAFLESRADSQQKLAAIKTAFESLPESELPEIPKNRRSIPDRSEALLLFKYSPSAFTADLLKVSFPFNEKLSKKAPSKAPDDPLLRFGDDPIKLARGPRRYVFPAFTALPAWGGSDRGSPRWKEFDIAAFKEALKALHQIEAKGAEREKQKLAVIARIERMESGAPWKSHAESEEDTPPVLKGDPRFERLNAIGTALADSHPDGEYTLSQRTVRGYRDLIPKLNRIAPAGSEPVPDTIAKLKAEVVAYQGGNPNTVGSADFLNQLVLPENWVVWQKPAVEVLELWRKAAKLKPDDAFAQDPIKAYIDLQDLQEEAERLSQPINFTPADPIHSRRQFFFTDVCSFTERGEYRLESNNTAMIVPIAREAPGSIKVERARIHFSAPRMLRDGLRDANGQSLGAARFLQPMAKALGLSEAPLQDISKHAVALMPDIGANGEPRILLNFPIALDTQPLIDRLGKAAIWTRQFAQFDDANYYLRWPETVGKAKVPPQGWWWKQVQSFSCLAADLGQRDAAAFAIVQASSQPTEKPSREIGTIREGAHPSTWSAAVSATGLLKLPGEDAKILSGASFRQEPCGSRGRPNDAADWSEALSMAATLGMQPDALLSKELHKRSYPKTNDKLLVAFRRSQSRLRRLQSLSWRLRQPDKSEAAHAEIAQAEDLVVIVSNKAALSDASLLALEVDRAAEQLKAVLARTLPKIADRILPRKEQLWEWVPSGPAQANWILRPGRASPVQTPKIMGQRGLSMERIEQLEELRKRAQSLNRAMAHVIGERPASGRQDRGVNRPDPCPDILEKLSRIREQRVKQTAHLILAEALGLRLKTHALPRRERSAKDIHGEYESVRPPVDFIVLEDLSRYLSSQGRGPSENSRLMKWCHRAILSTLKELCEPYGISVVEANASYSSRFCSRTGAAGFRAEEVNPQSLGNYRWKRAFKQLEQIRNGEKRGDKAQLRQLERTEHLASVLNQINEGRDARKAPRSLLAPYAGGRLFIPAKGAAMQADINAAINLALRAVASPSAHSVYPKIRAKRDGPSYIPLRASIREKARWTGQEGGIQLDKPDTAPDSGTKQINFFVDVANIAPFEKASCPNIEYNLATSKGLWTAVKNSAWHIVNRLNNDRLEKWGFSRPLDEGGILLPEAIDDTEADVPFD